MLHSRVHASRIQAHLQPCFPALAHREMHLPYRPKIAMRKTIKTVMTAVSSRLVGAGMDSRLRRMVLPWLQCSVSAQPTAP